MFKIIPHSQQSNHQLRNPLVARSIQQSLSTLDGSNVRKRLDVAIVGAPNAGKSQLLNALTKTKVAAVSRKRHTTRTDVLGARTAGNTQIVFKDTPGFLRLENAKEERLDRDLIITAAAEMQHVDYCLLVVDSARKLTDNYRHALVQLMIGAINSKGRIEDHSDDEESERVTEKIKKRTDAKETSKFAIVLNKVDLVDPKSKLIDLAMEIGEAADACLVDHVSKDSEPKAMEFEQLLNIAPVVFYVSALEEEGVDDLLEHLLEKASPCTSWPVEPGKSTNMTTPEQVQELIREKIYRVLHQELPHNVHQMNRLFRRVEDGVIIHQDLVVFSKSHQKLVLNSLQRIQDTATKDLKELLKCDVSLRLHVKLNKSKQRRNMEDYSM